MSIPYACNRDGYVNSSVTLYRYINGDGSLKERGQRLMDLAG